MIPAGAAAQGTRREVLVVRATGELHEQALAIAARVIELRAAAGIDVARPPEVAAEVEGDTIAAATLRADEAFAALAFSDARRAIDAALDLADEGHAASRDELVAVWLISSMVYGALGDASQADDAARNALVIDPELVIDPARYPPTLGARVDALRPLLTTCALVLARDPADAALRVDGDAVEAAPTALPCGAHWITLSRPGYAPTTRRIVLVPGAEPSAIRVALVIDPAAALATPSAPGERVPSIVDLGASALGRSLTVLDVTRDEDGAMRATLGPRVVHVGASSTPDEVARALLAPIDRGPDSAVVIGVGVGIGAAVAAAIAIGLGVALAPSSPPGWTGVGEVVRP